jgi:hypothetical protein
MMPDPIHDFDADHVNSRVAGVVSGYWHRQGYAVSVAENRGPVWSDLRNLLRGYRGEDSIALGSEPSRRR